MATTTNPQELRRRRERIGLTRHQLAARAGCSLTAVANIEYGLIPRRGKVLGRILTALTTAENDTEPAANGLGSKEGDRDARHAA